MKNDNLNSKVQGLKFGSLMRQYVDEFRAKHPQKYWELYPIINQANNWIQVRSIHVCHYISIDGAGNVIIVDAEHGDEYAPRDNTINIADPKFADCLNSWFREIWGVWDTDQHEE
jgi:hypothetical protein